MEEMEGMAFQMRWEKMFALVDPAIPHLGAINGNLLEELFFRTLTGEREFNQLEKELVVVATDIISGEEVRINSGSVATALRTSTSLPGIFCLVELGPYMLVDGSVSTPVPVAAVREAGADIVVAVDVCFPVDRAEILIQALRWWKEVPSLKAQQLIDN